MKKEVQQILYECNYGKIVKDAQNIMNYVGLRLWQISCFVQIRFADFAIKSNFSG